MCRTDSGMILRDNENDKSRRGDFVRVILVSLVYCLVQIPNIVPASLILQVTVSITTIIPL